MKKLLLTMVLALFVSGNNLHAQDIEEDLITEKDGFQWILLQKEDLNAKKRGDDRYIKCAKDKYGKILIPLSKDYEFIYYSNWENNGTPSYFHVSQNGYKGAYTIDGRVIVEPKYGYVEYDKTSDVFVFREYYDYNNILDATHNPNPWYSLGVSLTKKGIPYISNNLIASNSKYYKPFTPPQSYKGSYTSSSAPILNEDNLAKGFITVMAGAAIIAGISDLFGNIGSSSKSSSNSNSSGSKTSSLDESVYSFKNVTITNVEEYQHNVILAKQGHLVLYLKNDNNYEVYVNVEVKVKGSWEKCYITYNEAPTEPLYGSYADDNSKDIHLLANSRRIVEVSFGLKKPEPGKIRITRVW